MAVVSRHCKESCAPLRNLLTKIIKSIFPVKYKFQHVTFTPAGILTVAARDMKLFGIIIKTVTGFGPTTNVFSLLDTLLKKTIGSKREQEAKKLFAFYI